MDSRFLADNSHLKGPQPFSETDPELSQLKSQRFIHSFNSLLERFPIDAPGIYTLTGTHRVGKTTVLKTWMEKLLAQGIPEKAIVFFSANSIKEYRELHSILQKQLAIMPSKIALYVIIDDIDLIRDWEKAVKLLTQAGLLERVILLLSSADSAVAVKQTLVPKNHFHLYPLSFREAVLLKHSNADISRILFEEFNHYLLHGGYLEVINDIAMTGSITDKTLTTYTDWMTKEIVRQGKQERYLLEILSAVLKHYNEQVTWNSLAQELTIDHPKTIGDYFALLESIDLVFVQYALTEETLKLAPKKARKLMFTDPFIFHAMQAALIPGKNYFETQMKPLLDNPGLCSKLVETCVITQFRRHYPTYYIKAEGEIDLAYLNQERFWPIETTWTSQIRAKDLKQILKYANGRILTKTERSGVIEHIRTEPLPLALWQLEETK